MISGLAWVVMGLAAVAVAWGWSPRSRTGPGKAQLVFAAVIELVTLVQSGLALVALLGGFRPVELGTTVGYLIGIVLLIPLAWFWANNERTRFSGVVLAVAAASVLVMTLRLLSLWTTST